MKDDRPYLADILLYFLVDLAIVRALIDQRAAGHRRDLARLAATLGAPR